MSWRDVWDSMFNRPVKSKPQLDDKDAAALRAAERRIGALDLRVEVLTRRQTRHERSPHEPR